MIISLSTEVNFKNVEKSMHIKKDDELVIPCTGSYIWYKFLSKIWVRVQERVRVQNVISMTFTLTWFL